MVNAVCFGNNAKHHKPMDTVNTIHSEEKLQLIIQYQQHPTFHTATKTEFTPRQGCLL